MRCYGAGASQISSNISRLTVFVTADICCDKPSSLGDADARPRVLVVPANEQLQGAQFSPAEAAAAGHSPSVVYPEQTVDGQAHLGAGAGLAVALRR